jgi:hypothetical protein
VVDLTQWSANFMKQRQNPKQETTPLKKMQCIGSIPHDVIQHRPLAFTMHLAFSVFDDVSHNILSQLTTVLTTSSYAKNHKTAVGGRRTSGHSD